MDIVHPRVAGIDVHKKVISVAVRLPGQGTGQRAVTVRRFKAFWRSLQKMAGWLADTWNAGTDYYERRDQRNREHLVRYHQNALARLGIQVIVTPFGDGAPPPPTPDNPGQAA